MSDSNLLTTQADLATMGVVKDTYDIARQIIRALGTTLKSIRRVPAVDDFLDRLERRFLDPIVIRRAKNPHSADLLSAVELYDQRIPEEQQVESVDIIRWVREARA
jgi:hypothetical protein